MVSQAAGTHTPCRKPRTPSSSHTAKHVVDVWLGKLIAIVIADPRKVGSAMEKDRPIRNGLGYQSPTLSRPSLRSALYSDGVTLCNRLSARWSSSCYHSFLFSLAFSSGWQQGKYFLDRILLAVAPLPPRALSPPSGLC